jgi:hypothetical protein
MYNMSEKIFLTRWQHSDEYRKCFLSMSDSSVSCLIVADLCPAVIKLKKKN